MMSSGRYAPPITYNLMLLLIIDASDVLCQWTLARTQSRVIAAHAYGPCPKNGCLPCSNRRRRWNVGCRRPTTVNPSLPPLDKYKHSEIRSDATFIPREITLLRSWKNRCMCALFRSERKKSADRTKISPLLCGRQNGIARGQISPVKPSICKQVYKPQKSLSFVPFSNLIKALIIAPTKNAAVLFSVRARIFCTVVLSVRRFPG